MEPDRNDFDLDATLRAIRPAPSPDFAAILDARVEDRFPRDPGTWRSRLAALANAASAIPLRHIVAPAGAVATAVVVAAVILSSGGDTAPPSGSGSTLSALSEGDRAAAPATHGAGDGDRLGKTAAGATSASGTGGVQFDARPATIAPGSGPYASRAGHRDIERSAQLVLGAEPSEVRAGAGKVFDAVHATGGIVLRSSIQDGDEGEAGASFELLIPSPRLGDALAAFSGIAEVRSRRESTQDITAPTIGVEERLEDSRARIESLLGQLAVAGSDAERTAVEAKLRAAWRHAAALRSRLSSLRRRANFSRVSVRIETGAPAAIEKDGGSWGVTDGFDGASRVLAVAGGVSVIALAIVAPLALIALLAWLTHRTLLRRRRERALG